MSLLGSLHGKWLESTIAPEFALYKNKIDQMIEGENAVLRSLGIPPPPIASEMSYEMKLCGDGKFEITLVPPKFDFPPCQQFVVVKDSLIVSCFNHLEEIMSHLSSWGLAEVLNNEYYGDIWTNRDPFEFYLMIQLDANWKVIYDRQGKFTSEMQKPTGNSYYRANLHENVEKLPPLEDVPRWSYEELVKMHMIVRLFNSVTGGEHGCLRDAKNYYQRYGNASLTIPENILFELPVASPWISGNLSAVKILPCGEIKPAQMVEFLNSLRTFNQFISFELVRSPESVFFQICYPTESESELGNKLDLFLPGFEFSMGRIFSDASDNYVKWLTKKETYRPIRRLRDFHIDPYVHFASVFENAAPDDLACYQVIFAPLTDGAAAIIKNHLATTNKLKKDYSGEFARKLPLWIARFSVSSTNERLMNELAEKTMSNLDAPDQNLILPNNPFILTDNFPPKLYGVKFSLYETDELAALAHFPITELPIENLERISMKNVQPPELYTSGEMRVGEARARGQIFPVTMPEEVRDRHLYIVGKSGTGKSTLMETLARRDIEAGRGIAVIDPHGDLIQRLLEAIPEERVSDCVLFSPRHFPVSLEILSAESEHEIDLLSDDLITMFRRTSESWGDKMQAILQMAFQTLLRVPGSSFTDITPLLTDENYRNRILAKINHPQLASFWQHRYEMRQAEPILIRMDRLTTSGTLRAVLTQNKNSLNFYDVITESKIFLADLSKGYLGESTSHLLGSIIVSQIQLAAMRQAHLPQEQRIPFSLFVDEVQNFTTSAFTTILSEARKQKLRLTIAHQFVSQLPGDIQKAVFGNVGTMMFFALSPDDLGAARHELGSFEPQDVANLPKYHALCRPVTAARDTFAFVTDAPAPPLARNYTQLIIEQTRREYGAAIGSREEAPPPASVTVQAPSSQPSQNASPLPVVMMDSRRPAVARPLSFATNTEKILHFLRQAEYLSQPQIIALTDLQASNASTALKKLVETGQIKSLDDRRPKIYFIGRSANPTTHNLLVRDLFVKINASNYAVQSVKFNDNLAELNPDLTVEFVAQDGASLLAYFELDRGTEGASELVRKAERYAKIPHTPRVGFIFERESDMQLAQKTINYPFILYATLNQFTSLRDEAFYAGGTAPAGSIQLPFFR